MLRSFGNSISRRFFSTKTDDVVVSILGAPNAGKSTLFNRLMDKAKSRTYRLSSDKKSMRIKRKHYTGGSKISSQMLRAGGAIVSTIPGTTRDRRECWGLIGSTSFRMVDTAGIDGYRILSKDHLDKQILRQTWEAARKADLIFLLMDARIGVMSADWMDTAQWLRRNASKGQKVMLVANKLEGDSWNYKGSPILDTILEASRLGFGQPLLISAIHGDGMADLALAIEEVKKEKQKRLGIQHLADDEEVESIAGIEKNERYENSHSGAPLKIAILGRQNVGKSTLVNKLLGQERVISGPTPGLTRDAIETEWNFDGKTIQLVDTAGIKKFTSGINKLSPEDKEEDVPDEWAVRDALRAMKVADVAVMVLDAATTKLLRHELSIMDAVVKEGRALVVVANKQDLLIDNEYSSQDFANSVSEHLETRLPMLRQTPVVAISGLYQSTDELQSRIMPVVLDAYQRWNRTISTGTLNRWLKEVVLGHPPPHQEGRPTKFKYILQTKGRPPTFIIFTNQPKLPEPYVRFLMRNFQDTFEYFGMEIRLILKYSREDNPFAPKKKRSGSGLGGSKARKKRGIQQLKSFGAIVKGRKMRSSLQKFKKQSRQKGIYKY
mmetsp:Transcript_19246/g.29010  ORF Transcript_19246/g.29010 Transcript_19246/m.29010 type:complete len:608 (-) Transcript_19246:112-1935(-)